MGEASAPVRMRLSRAKGFNLQAESRALNGREAVKVSRPGVFGNPFTIQDAVDVHECSQDAARRIVVEWFREWLTQPSDHHDQSEMGAWGPWREQRAKLLARLPELRGKNLACWCRQPRMLLVDHCHAAVLLEIANTPPRSTATPEADHAV